jgi:hypothetical protein
MPQLLLSVWRLTHVPAQVVNPALQANPHAPLAQVAVALAGDVQQLLPHLSCPLAQPPDDLAQTPPVQARGLQQSLSLVQPAPALPQIGFPFGPDFPCLWRRRRLARPGAASPARASAPPTSIPSVRRREVDWTSERTRPSNRAGSIERPSWSEACRHARRANDAPRGRASGSDDAPRAPAASSERRISPPQPTPPRMT